MARSRRHTPIFGITLAVSEKQEKRKNHRRERRRVHAALATNPQSDLLPHTRELSNPWGMAKDGKQYWGGHVRPSDLRK